MRSLSTFLYLLLIMKVQMISIEIVIRYEGWFLSFRSLYFFIYMLQNTMYPFKIIMNYTVWPLRSLSWLHGYIRYEREKVFCRHALQCVPFQLSISSEKVELFKGASGKENKKKRVQQRPYSLYWHHIMRHGRVHWLNTIICKLLLNISGTFFFWHASF